MDTTSAPPQDSRGTFFALTPERVLAAVEQAGEETTGLCYALNSLENRVYEVELEGRRRVIAKFYRPNRWGRDTILGEHRLLQALAAAEIPVAAPEPFPDADTLHTTTDGIRFALFPRVGGRSPDDLTLEQYEELGRMLGRIHNVLERLTDHHRPALSPETYGRQSLETILARTRMPDGLKNRYQETASRLVAKAEERFRGVPSQLLHADCHRGNLLYGAQGFLFLDFDDAATGPAVQDLWLLLPARPKDCPNELEAFARGYEIFREFPWATLNLVEALRGLRYLRYAGWVAARWDDPSFPRAFPHWGTDNYWEAQLADLNEQLWQLEEEGAP
ncbi:MAG: serine/threonine protein kinase [Deltaproteobacteria bacterium]|nr:serine/threonine protein kinase [Deltaproteobacteria bacterium]